MTTTLDDIVKRAAAWPLDAQEELAAIARELEAALRGELHHPTAEEAAGIARGLEAAEVGRFVSEADVASVIARHLPA
jgi:predicted transcriptional regulator